MSTLGLILLATFFVSILAFIGVLTFFLRQELLNRALMVLVALSAGALVGGAFLHLLPEAIEEAGLDLNIFLFLLLGFCLFFILEQFLRWRHEHPSFGSTGHTAKPFSYLILVSDGVHNFIDGLVIAAGFLSGYQIGVVTTLAVALHEVPQELGDFGVLVYGGFGRTRALVFNYISAITSILGGVVGYIAGSAMATSSVYLLPFAAGTFIYVAAADLIPEIKHSTGLGRSMMHFFVFLTGVGIMLAMKYVG